MKFTLRYMQLPDIPQVVAIDRLSFDLPWATRSYAHEISEASYSHMVVLEQAEEPPPPQGWRRWMAYFNGSPSPPGRIVGYGGLWNIMSEAHISTIAIHPQYRGNGWGEILLAGMVGKSISLEAGFVVLEVRVSNQTAQNLYRKYAFQTIGVKPRYYRNNNEDAYDMRLNLDTPGTRAHYAGLLAALHAAHDYADLFSTTNPPRRPLTSN